MQGASNIQQTGAVTTPSASQAGAGQALQKGQVNGEPVAAQTNVASKMENAAEEVAMFTGNKNRKLHVKSKKASDVKQNQKTQKGSGTEKASATAPGTDSSNLEEISLYRGMLKKLSKGEELSEKEEDYLRDGMDEDTYNAAEQMLVKAVEMLDKEGRKDIHTRKIENLKKQLDKAKGNNKKVDVKFWGSLNEFISLLKMPGVKRKGRSEQQREFINNLKDLDAKLGSKYKVSSKQIAVAIEIKRIGNEISQVNNDKIRLSVLGKEMHVLQTYRTMEEESTESENKIARTHGFQLKDASPAPNDSIVSDS